MRWTWLESEGREVVAVTLEGRRLVGFELPWPDIFSPLFTGHVPPDEKRMIDPPFAYAGVGEDGVLEYIEASGELL